MAGLAKRRSAKVRKSVEIAHRRRHVALMLKTYEQKEIAALLGVSEATICSDVAALKEAYARDASADINELVQREMLALDGDELELRCELAEARTFSAKLRIMEALLPVMRRRSELAGLDAITRKKLSNADAGGGSLDALLASVLDS